MSLADLRSRVLAEGAVERVEVNQRHLIDKILARYSAPFTIFRELLQNANDAGAAHVEIRFSGIERSGFLFTARETYRMLEVRNDGRVFSAQDWGRLRKIAEGNPDEHKIGFFGVGFYSLFSIADEPLCVARMPADYSCP